MQKIRDFVSPSFPLNCQYSSQRVPAFSASNRHLRLIVKPSGKTDPIWVLLTRHQVSSKRNSEYIALHVHDQAEGNGDITRIAAKVCRAIYYADPFGCLIVIFGRRHIPIVPMFW